VEKRWRKSRGVRCVPGRSRTSDERRRNARRELQRRFTRISLTRLCEEKKGGANREEPEAEEREEQPKVTGRKKQTTFNAALALSELITIPESSRQSKGEKRYLDTHLERGELIKMEGGKRNGRGEKAIS